MSQPPSEIERLRLERDLFLRLLELGARDDLKPFLEDALALITSATGARQGYLELHGDAPTAAGSLPRFWIASGFSDAELPLVRREISTGIVAEAIATGRTISTASAIDDPRFAAQQSVQAARIRAVLCAPIGGANAAAARTSEAPHAAATRAPLGVLYLSGRDVAGPFPEADRLCAEVFARHLAPLADR